MILEKRPITLAEVQLIVKDAEDKKDLNEYLNKFNKLKKNEADSLADKIRALNNLKLKEDDVIKIVDFLPETSEELNKICRDTTLSEEESNAILQLTKKH